jgi:hypothetical protein
MRSDILDRGIIRRRDGSIESKEWDKIIESHPALKLLPGQYGTSPFTGEKVLFPRKGVAACIVDGVEQGSLCYFDGKIAITNVPERFCSEIAALLKAELLIGVDSFSVE